MMPNLFNTTLEQPPVSYNIVVELDLPADDLTPERSDAILAVISELHGVLGTNAEGRVEATITASAPSLFVAVGLAEVVFTLPQTTPALKVRRITAMTTEEFDRAGEAANN